MSVGGDGGVDTVVDAEGVEELGDVLLDGAFGQMHGPADLGVGESASDVGEELDLALGEQGSEFVSRGSGAVARSLLGGEPAGDSRGERASAVREGPDAGNKLLRLVGFEEETEGAGVDRIGDEMVVGKGGEHGDRKLGLSVPDLTESSDAVESWHLDIQQCDVNAVCCRGVDGLVAVAGEGGDVKVNGGGENSGDAGADELVVIRDQDTDRRGVGAILRGHGAGTVPILLTWSEAKQTTWTSTRSKKLISAS